jgi:tetratricopeptide (TPR) repeat protein
MTSATFGSRLVAAVLAVGLTMAGAPVLAQTTGTIKGKVADGDGKPVERATVTIEFLGGVTIVREVRTNRRGEFIQVGLQPGPYVVKAAKEGVGATEEELRVGVGTAPELLLTLRPVVDTAEREADQAFRKVFGAGVQAAGAKKFEEAIARFSEAAGMQEECYACYMNIGNSYYQMQDVAKAEEAFKKAIEVSPEEPKPYQALADLYNSAGRSEEAATMASKAASLGGEAGGSAQDLFNQGVILWNAGKMAEAKGQFEAAIKADPNYADAQYWVGMANLNAGNVAESAVYFENYLKIAPTGEYAEQAKGVLASIKPQ